MYVCALRTLETNVDNTTSSRHNYRELAWTALKGRLTRGLPEAYMAGEHVASVADSALEYPKCTTQTVPHTDDRVLCAAKQGMVVSPRLWKETPDDGHTQAARAPIVA